MCFQPSEGPTRGLLRDCENFVEGSISSNIVITYTDAAAVPGSEGGAQQQAADQHQQHGRGHRAVFSSSPELETKVKRRFQNHQ